MSNQVKIGNLSIGGGNKIAVQSMTNVKLTDIDATLSQLRELESVGCDIVRIAIADKQSACLLPKVKSFTHMPIVADTHFNSEITLSAIENGADKVRINAGNMNIDEMERIADCAKMHNISIRIGVNGGSVGRSYLERYNKVDAIVANLTDFVQKFEALNFYDLVLSVKSSNVVETILANRSLSKRFSYPLHIGVTEAGLSRQGLIKNSIGIGALLCDGIGDTIRVSLTANPVEEVNAGHDILRSLGLNKGVNFVSCPKCGRCNFDLEKTASAIYEKIKHIKQNLTIAVMGCEVNGPGECAQADLGLAGGNGKVAFFKKGKVFKIVADDVGVEEFSKEIDLLLKENN